MEKVEKEADLNRRKFMEIGIYTITGTIAAASGVALARFAVGSSFDNFAGISQCILTTN